MEKITVGTDIVHLPKFEKFLEDENAVRRVFHPSELKDSRAEHLGGIFAAKEAFFKAVGRNPEWLDVEVKNGRDGKPSLSLPSGYGSVSAEVSISHDGDYAVATVVAAKNEDSD